MASDASPKLIFKFTDKGRTIYVYDNNIFCTDASTKEWDWFWHETNEGPGCIFMCLKGDDVTGFKRYPEMNKPYEEWIARMMLDE